MPSAGGDLQRPLHLALASDVVEIDVVGGGVRAAQFPSRYHAGVESAGEKLHRLGERCYGNDIDSSWRNLGLLTVFGGDEDTSETLFTGGEDHRQDAVDTTHRTIEGQLADHAVASRALPLQDRGGFEDADSDGQVEAGPFLLEIGRGKIDGDSFAGKGIAAVADRGLDPVLALAHRAVGKAHGGKARQPPGNIDLHLDDPAIDADYGATGEDGEHGDRGAMRSRWLADRGRVGSVKVLHFFAKCTIFLLIYEKRRQDLHTPTAVLAILEERQSRPGLPQRIAVHQAKTLELEAVVSRRNDRLTKLLSRVDDGHRTAIAHQEGRCGKDLVNSAEHLVTCQSLLFAGIGAATAEGEKGRVAYRQIEGLGSQLLVDPAEICMKNNTFSGKTIQGEVFRGKTGQGGLCLDADGLLHRRPPTVEEGEQHHPAAGAQVDKAHARGAADEMGEEHRIDGEAVAVEVLTQAQGALVKGVDTRRLMLAVFFGHGVFDGWQRMQCQTMVESSLTRQHRHRQRLLMSHCPSAHLTASSGKPEHGQRGGRSRSSASHACRQSGRGGIACFRGALYPRQSSQVNENGKGFQPVAAASCGFASPLIFGKKG